MSALDVVGFLISDNFDSEFSTGRCIGRCFLSHVCMLVLQIFVWHNLFLLQDNVEPWAGNGFFRFNF